MPQQRKGTKRNGGAKGPVGNGSQNGNRNGGFDGNQGGQGAQRKYTLQCMDCGDRLWPNTQRCPKQGCKGSTACGTIRSIKKLEEERERNSQNSTSKATNGGQAGSSAKSSGSDSQPAAGGTRKVEIHGVWVTVEGTRAQRKKGIAILRKGGNADTSANDTGGNAQAAAAPDPPGGSAIVVSSSGESAALIARLEKRIEVCVDAGWEDKAEAARQELAEAKKPKAKNWTIGQAKRERDRLDAAGIKAREKYYQIEGQLEKAKVEAIEIMRKREEIDDKIGELLADETRKREEKEKEKEQAPTPPPCNLLRVAEFLGEEVPFIKLDFDGALPEVLDTELCTEEEAAECQKTKDKFHADLAAIVQTGFKEKFLAPIAEYNARIEA